MRMMLGMVLAMAAGGPAAAQGAAAGDIAQGLAIARTWCANCHVVEARPASATADSVPGFPAIAARPNLSAAGLTTYLAEPHGRMPNLTLSRNDTADVVAYILSLRAR